MGPGAISVIIVNWNAREDLCACLRSLADQTDRAFQTIVVDNGSSDGSEAAVRAEFPWVEIVQTGANLGFAEGCNQGLAVATGEWIATLNNDTFVDPAWIAELRSAALSSPPEVGMLQSRMVFKSDKGRINSTGLLLYKDGSAEDRDFDTPVREDDEGDAVFCPTAGAALYRRAMLDQTRLASGWFDRDYFMYCEDVDLGWRCRLAGWEARYVPSALVAHAFQGSSKLRERSFIGLHLKRNRLRTLLKNASVPFLVKALPRTLLDLGRAFTQGGPLVLPSFAIAVRDGLVQRRAVSALSRVPRLEVEQRWAVKRRRS